LVVNIKSAPLCYPACKSLFSAPYYTVTCDLSACTILFHIISQTVRFSGKDFQHKMCNLIFYKYLSAIFLSVRIIQLDIFKNVRRFFMWISSYSSHILKTLEFSGQSLQKSNFIKDRPVGTVFCHAVRIDRGTDVTKITVSFCNYSKAPIQSIVSQNPFLFQPFDNNGRT